MIFYCLAKRVRNSRYGSCSRTMVQVWKCVWNSYYSKEYSFWPPVALLRTSFSSNLAPFVIAFNNSFSLLYKLHSIDIWPDDMRCGCRNCWRGSNLSPPVDTWCWSLSFRWKSPGPSVQTSNSHLAWELRYWEVTVLYSNSKFTIKSCKENCLSPVHVVITFSNPKSLTK